MSIRIRTVDGVRVALCAAETDSMPGDTYLDDGDHHALNTKFTRDLAEEGFIREEALPLWSASEAAVADSQVRAHDWLQTTPAKLQTDPVSKQGQDL